MESIKDLKITLPIVLDSIHTCCNAFRMVKRIGKGSQGHVFLALHVPTMKIYAIKRIKSNTVPSLLIMKKELKTLRELCRNVEVGGDGLVQPRPTTVTYCQKCVNERNLELNDCGKLVEKTGPDTPVSPAVGQRLLTEGTYNCPYVVQFFDNFPDMGDGSQCFVLEYMHWGSLQDILTAGHLLVEHDLAIVAYSVLQALQYLFLRGYVHRDVKPANILLDAWGHVKLGDFGTVCLHDQQSSHEITRKNSILAGTLNYMSPEGFQAESHSHKSDIWSLGVTLTHLMHGVRPFADTTSYWGLRNSVTSATLLSYLPECAKTHDHSNAIMDFLSRSVTADVSERYTASQLLQMPFILNAVPPVHTADVPLSSPTSVTATAAAAASLTKVSSAAKMSTVAGADAATVRTSSAVSAVDDSVVNYTYASTEPPRPGTTTASAPAPAAGTGDFEVEAKADAHIDRVTSTDSCGHDSKDATDSDPQEPPRLTELVAQLRKEHPADDLSVLAFIIADESAPEVDISDKLELLAEQIAVHKPALDALILQKRPRYTEFG